MTLKYRPEIDGLRAVAVLSVVFYHAELVYGGVTPFQGGFIGVDVFFVISGYLITSIILRELHNDTFSFASFYERRARRILPAFFTVLLCTLPIAYSWLSPARMIDYAKSAVASVAVYSNVFFWKQSGYFAPEADEMPLLHTWSLSVEEQFYLLFPVVLLLLWKYARRHLVFVLLVALISSLVLAEYTSGWRPAASFYLLPTRGWELLAGAVLAMLELNKSRGHGSLVGAVMPTLGLLMIGYSIVAFDDQMRHPGFATSLSVVGAMLVIWFAARGEPVGQVLSSKPFVRIGLISYSLYLWHFPILVFARIKDALDSNLDKYQYIALSILLAIISYFLVERPVRQKKISFPKFMMLSLVSATLLLSFSAGSLLTNGFIGRYNEDDLQLAKFDRETFAAYVNGRYSDYDLKPFDSSDKPRVLIIGDSYAKDLLNGMLEVGLSDAVQLSTYHISARCGNLLLDYDFSDKVAPRDKTLCAADKGYKSKALQSLIGNADVIWLASSWKPWQVDLLGESLANIRARTKAKVLILGKKHFGKINVDSLIAIPARERMELKGLSDPRHIKINSVMKNSFDKTVFIDLQELLCDGQHSCPVFDKGGNLISYDGTHLTKAGATYLGQRLASYDVVRSALRLPEKTD